MKKSRVWQAIVPGTQNKPQDIFQIRKTPWHGVTKQPPAVPLPGPNVTPEPNEKIKGLAANCSRHTKQATKIRKTPWHGVTKQPPGTQNKPQDTLQIRKTPWHGVTNEKIKGLAGNSSRHTKQATRHPSNPAVPLPGPNVTWHGVTKQPPAVPLPGPNVTPEPNEKIKGLAGNCSRHRNQATRHP